MLDTGKAKVFDQRARIDRDATRYLLGDRIRIIRGMIREGYAPGTTLAAALQDLENGGAPLANRIGRGFTA